MPEASDSGVVDDGQMFSRLYLGFGKCAAPKEWRPHHVQEIRADGVVLHLDWIFHLGYCGQQHHLRHSVRRQTKRRTNRIGDLFYAWESGETFAPDRELLRRLLMIAQDPDREHVVASHPEVLYARIHKTAHQHSSGNEQRDGDRHLRRDKTTMRK